METQQAVKEWKELIAKLRKAAIRIMVDGQSDLRSMHKLVLCIRQRMREIQHKTESLKDQCTKARDDTDTLTLEVEKVNYLREAYRVSIERAEKQPTPEMEKLRIDPTQDAETVLEALETERKVSVYLGTSRPNAATRRGAGSPESRYCDPPRTGRETAEVPRNGEQSARLGSAVESVC